MGNTNSKSEGASNLPREEIKRITVDVPAYIHKALKVRAAAEGTTVSEILRGCLAKSLEEWRKSTKD